MRVALVQERALPDGAWKVWLYRPFLDLAPVRGGPLHLQRVELDYRNFESASRGPHGLQRVLPASFRESLIYESGLIDYNISDPIQLPVQLRTERWQRLCDVLGSWETTDESVRALAAALLVSLCLYRVVPKYIAPLPSEAICHCEHCARLAYIRATARYILHLDYGTPYGMEEFRQIVDRARPGSLVRINSMLHMLVQSARDKRSVESVARWAEVAKREILASKADHDEFSFHLLMSRYYRASSFLPYMQGNRERLVEEMNLAEEHAEALTPRTATEDVIARENSHPLIESRTKEALWLGDLDLAEQRARRLVALDPYDPKPRIELGEVLARRGKMQEAATAYRSAALLGPPGTAIAWFMAGQCLESLQDLEAACDCYLRSIQADPLGTAALEALHALGERLDNRTLTKWTGDRLAVLREQRPRPLTELLGGNYAMPLQESRP